MRRLRDYQNKRDFNKTKEPAGVRSRTGTQATFVIQQHSARRLHWDFRLSVNGVLKSWAVTKEPSLDPAVRRLAVETEDHPLEYAKFHGDIPPGQYGAGQVLIWDHGTYSSELPLTEAIDRGKIKVFLHGRKLKGTFILIRMQTDGSRPAQWLFFKAKPEAIGLLSN